jgi:hypothetical protein
VVIASLEALHRKWRLFETTAQPLSLTAAAANLWLIQQRDMRTVDYDIRPQSG